MRRLNLAPLLFLSLLALSVPFASAQINGVPSSVTSPGFGGRAINGTPASVTSLGPRGYAPVNPVRPVPNARFTANGPRGDGHHRHHRQNDFSIPLVYAVPVPVPYAADNTAVEDQSASDDYDPEYQGGPTVFDRRGSGANSYIPPVDDTRRRSANSDLRAEDGRREDLRSDDRAAPADPEPPQAPTLLVFKDGHNLEVGNYAIVGPTLFDLTPGHPRKIALVDLDLEATRQQNDDRGIPFALPQSAQAN